jgi:hypothetical protein
MCGVEELMDRFRIKDAEQRFTRYGWLLETEQACADALEGTLNSQTLPPINIPVVYVSTNIAGDGVSYNGTLVASFLAALNAAYARIGLTFNLAASISADFDTADDAFGLSPGCEAQSSDDCPRCTAYNSAPETLRTPGTLYIYGVKGMHTSAGACGATAGGHGIVRCAIVDVYDAQYAFQLHQQVDSTIVEATRVQMAILH